MAAGVPARLTAAEGRRFALTLSAAFLLFAAIAWYRDRPAVAVALGTPGCLLALLGVTVPSRLGPLQAWWMQLAHQLSRVTTPIFMGLAYFLVITPIGLLKRTIGTRALVHQPVQDSYWQRVEAHSDGDRSMTRQF